MIKSEIMSTIIANTTDPVIAAQNAESIGRRASYGEHMQIPGGDIWIGGEGIKIGQSAKAVSFLLTGNGSHYFGRSTAPQGAGPTVLRPIPGVKTLMTVGGDTGGHHAGRSWGIRDICFYNSEGYKEYRGDAPVALDIQGGDTFEVRDCSFRNFRIGTRLVPRERSRLVCGAVSNCEYQRNTTGIYAAGAEPLNSYPSTHTGLELIRCNSVQDKTAFHLDGVCNGITARSCVSHASHSFGFRITRGTLATLDGVYAEAGGPGSRYAISVEDDSKVLANRCIGLYLNCHPTATVRAKMCRFSHGSAISEVTYGNVADTHDSIGFYDPPHGFTAFPGDRWTDAAGIAWEVMAGGGYGSGHTAAWVPVKRIFADGQA